MCEGKLIVCNAGHRTKRVTTQCPGAKHRYPYFDRSTCRDPQVNLRYDILSGPDFHECQHWECKRAKAENDWKLAAESEKAWRTALHEDIMSSGEGRRRQRCKPSTPSGSRLPKPPSSPSQDSMPPHFTTSGYTETRQQAQPAIMKDRKSGHCDIRLLSIGQLLSSSPSSSANASACDSSTSARNASCSTDQGIGATTAEQQTCPAKAFTCSMPDHPCSAVKLFDGTVDHKPTVIPTGCFTADMASAGIWWEQRVDNRQVTVVNLRILARYAATLNALMPRRSTCPVLYSSQEYDYKKHRFRKGADPAAYCQRPECGHPVSAVPSRKSLAAKVL